MTAKPKPKFDPRQLQPTSGRKRMVIDHPVDVVRQPDEAEQAPPDRTPPRKRRTASN